MRYIPVLIALVACSKAESQPTPDHTGYHGYGSGSAQFRDTTIADGKRNFVCERVKVANEKATCAPELSGVGELATHTARVTIGAETVSCAINSQQVGVVCGPLFVAPQQPAQQPPAKVEKKK